jgi:hypothetical protein
MRHQIQGTIKLFYFGGVYEKLSYHQPDLVYDMFRTLAFILGVVIYGVRWRYCILEFSIFLSDQHVSDCGHRMFYYIMVISKAKKACSHHRQFDSNPMGWRSRNTASNHQFRVTKMCNFIMRKSHSCRMAFSRSLLRELLKKLH